MQPRNQETFDQIEAETRGLDPIEVATDERYDDAALVEQTQRDIERIDTILATDDTITPREQSELYSMGCNLRLEWLYAKHGGGSADKTEFDARWDEANGFFGRAIRRAGERKDRFPNDYWEVALKHLDLRAAQAHRNARESQTTLRGTEAGRQVWALADSQMQGIIMDSTRLMSEMLGRAEGPTRNAQDTRGKLYETMLLTYARLETYEDESFDTTLVRSALDREDRPWDGHAYPKRSFDLVIDSGEKGKRLIQAKNYNNDDEYAAPIQKVEDTHFASTMRDGQRIVASFLLVAGNSANPNLQGHIDRAHRHLDMVFGPQLEPAQEPVHV